MNAPQNMFQFEDATKLQAKLRLAISGPPGGGKTMSALKIGEALAEGGVPYLVDTEHGSASLYANLVKFKRLPVKDDYDPRKVGQIIKAAAAAGAKVLIFDSFTHFWNGPGGFLELVDAEAKRAAAASRNGAKTPDSFAAWKAIDPIYRRMVQDLLAAPMHIIVTLRAKTENERVQEGNRTIVKKLGMAPEIRDNFQYEMSIEGMMTMDNEFIVGKTRCPAIKGKIFSQPGADLAAILQEWLSDGAPDEEAERERLEEEKRKQAAALADEERQKVSHLSSLIGKAFDDLGTGDKAARGKRVLEILGARPVTAADHDRLLQALLGELAAKHIAEEPPAVSEFMGDGDGAARAR